MSSPEHASEIAIELRGVTKSFHGSLEFCFF